MGELRLALCVAVAMIAGCGEVADDPDAAGGAIDAAEGTIDSGADAPDAPPGTPDAADTGGCTSSASCPAARYCDFPDNRCGKGARGACRPLPDGCSGGAVCSCGNDIYSDECAAAGAGFDVAEGGSCDTPDGFFRCGYRYCLQGLAYCEVRPSSDSSTATGYACPTLPVGCTSCDCLLESGVECADTCATGPDGDLTVTCPAG